MYGLGSLYKEMLKRNIVFRFDPERLASLKERNLGLGFEPPSRTVNVRGVQVTDEVIPTSFEPVVISPVQWQQCQELCRAWDSFYAYAFQKFSSAQQSGELNGYGALIGTPDERASFSVHPGYSSLMPFVRYDCAIRPNGTFVVMDVNSSRPIGAGHMFALTKLFIEAGLTDAVPIATPDSLIETILKCYREWCVTNQTEPTDQPRLSIVIPESMGSQPDFRVLSKQLMKSGRFETVSLIDPEDLAVEGGALVGAVNGKREELQIVLRTVKPDLHPGIAPQLLDAYPNGACIVGPMWRRWLGSKLWMALAQFEPMRSEVSDALGDLAEPFFRSLPLTGLYRNGRVQFADGSRSIESLKPSDWVAKIPAGSSARGVYIGRSMPASAWYEGVTGFSDSTVIIQEFIEPRREMLTIPTRDGGAQRGSFLTKHGLFSFGGEAAGIEVHACLDSYKIHGGRGTIAVPAFVGQ